MSKDRIEDLFLRFRATGDVAALAEVYDRSVGELGRIAVYLSGSVAAAEDLLQDTYLIALQRAVSFQAGKPLMPWLLGILSNRCRDLQRARRRRAAAQLDPEQLGVEPGAAAEAAELRRVLLACIDKLPQAARPVLRLHLDEGLGAAAIARSLDRPEGTVRSQISRGLEQLRRLLPAGVAGVAVTALPAESLARLREQVLAHGSAAETVATAPAAGPWFLAGAVSILVLLSGWGLGWFEDAPPDRSTGTVRDAGVLDGDAEEAAVLGEAGSAAREVLPRAAVAAVVRVRAFVHDAQGQPLDGVPMRMPELGTWVARSAADGFVALEVPEAECPRQGLGPVLLGGEGWTLRRLNYQIQRPEGVRDVRIGPVEMQRGTRIHGRVTDTDGVPLRGAEVRVCLYKREIHAQDPKAWRYGSRRTPADWNRLGVPAQVASDAEGRYELWLPAAPGQRMLVGAEMPGRGSRVGEPIVIDGAAVAMPELQLPALQPEAKLSGQVLGVDGKPMPQASVSWIEVGARRARRSSVDLDVDARFVILPGPGSRLGLRAVGPDGSLLLASAGPCVAGEEVVLRMRPILPLETGALAGTLRVLDLQVGDEQARPVPAIQVRSLGQGLPSLPILAVPEGEGRFRLQVPAACHALRVTAPGMVSKVIRGPWPEGVQALVLEADVAIRGRVLRDGQPVAGARVELRRSCPPVFHPGVPFAHEVHPAALLFGRTDAEGAFEFWMESISLEPGTRLIVSAKAEGASWASTGPIGYPVPVELPEQVLELRPGGQVQGRLVVADGSSPQGWVLLLSRGDGRVRQVVLDASGRFRVGDLRAGVWAYALSQRTRIFQWLRAKGDPGRWDWRLPGGEVRIRAGAQTDLDLEVPSCRERLRRVNVRLGTQPAAGWTICWAGARGQQFRQLDAEGACLMQLAPVGPTPFHLCNEDRSLFLRGELELDGSAGDAAIVIPTGGLFVKGIAAATGGGRRMFRFLVPAPSLGTWTVKFTAKGADEVVLRQVPAGQATLQQWRKDDGKWAWCDLREFEVRAGEETIVDLSPR